MSKQTYTGVHEPKTQFERLKPAVDIIRAMQRTCRPFGKDYMILGAAIDGLDTAAYHFTRHPGFFGTGGHGHTS